MSEADRIDKIYVALGRFNANKCAISVVEKEQAGAFSDVMRAANVNVLTEELEEIFKAS